MDMHAEGMVTDRQQRGELKALEGTPAHKGLHTIDIFRRDAGQLNILSPLRFFNQRMKDRIQHIVLGQRILILLARTQLRRRRLIEDVLRNGAHPFALIEPLRELVHLSLIHI